VVLRRDLWDEVMALSGDVGARRLIRTRLSWSHLSFSARMSSTLSTSTHRTTGGATLLHLDLTVVGRNSPTPLGLEEAPMPEAGENSASSGSPAKQRMRSRSRALRRENMPHEATR